MDVSYGSILDVALGGPEIGPQNLSVLHGLLRDLFHKFELSNSELRISEDDAEFGEAFNFIKNKLQERKESTALEQGTPPPLRSKISVIVNDYGKSPVGLNRSLTPAPPPTDLEERLRLLESQMQLVKDFPSVEELQKWAGQNSTSDTVVTDLWHFTSLNHRMSGTEEGIQQVRFVLLRLSEGKNGF